MSTESAALRQQISALSARLQQVESLEATTQQKPFDFKSYPQRKVALLFSYEGWHYSGLAYQKNQATPLPTVESELINALLKSRLITSVEECDFSRCGRTDKGVSSSGQVVSLYVRSALLQDQWLHAQALQPGQPLPSVLSRRDPDPAPIVQSADATKDEFNYATLLNRLLPQSIRILAWSPISSSFDARFSCLSRQYKYFFTSTAAAPLNIPAMQDAAERLVGEHDFRNMCKVDASKQITNYTRSIISASISRLSSTQFVLNLHGSAFLYHQVRHIMALLFLVGSGLEQPQLISDLLDVDLYPTKPDYEMANDLPLVLWKCNFADTALNWQVDPTAQARMHQALEPPEIKQQIRQLHVQAMDDVAGFQDGGQPPAAPAQLGGGTLLKISKDNYVSLSKRKRGEHFEVLNAKWRSSEKGQRIMAKHGFQPPTDDAE